MQPVTMARAKQPTSAVRAALTLIGFSAVIGQIVLMRELIVVFNGNEISLGIMLSTWLFWTAAGSGLSSGFRLGGNNARRAVAALECVLGVSLLPTIWALRASRSFFQTVPGELVGPVPMLLASLACLSLFCAVAGALFVAATRMYEQECAASARVATSSAYLLEAAGSGVGGILASIVLLHFLGSFQIATVVAVLNLCMAAVLLFRMSRKQLGAATVAAALFAVGLVTVVLLIYVAPALDTSAQARQWRGFRLVASRDSIYGNLAVIETGTETGKVRSIYDNGVILASAPDENAAEEAVHYALLEHPAPRHLLMIGGGVNGSIAQALKHPTVERIDYVELDPALIGMARQFFPGQSAPVVSDPRVHLHYADGRYFLKTVRDTFDVIILNVPDPQTAQLNRFYTAEFFRSARDHLASGGLLALQLRSSEDYISPDLGEYLRCIHHTLREVFPYVVAIPGETIHFFAATRPDVLTDNPQTLMARLQARNLKTQYVREYFIPFRMMPDRMEQVREQLRPLPSTPVNRDFEPIAYYFDVALWSTQFKLGYSRWFRAAARITFTGVIDAVLVVTLFVAVLLAFVPRREKLVRSSAACCMAATGYTLMALQIFLLLAFQSVYGYVYHQLAILIAMCMAGIAFGSWLGIRRTRSSDRPPYRTITTTQFLLGLSGPALIFVVSLLSRISGMATTWLAAQFVFPALAALCGMLGGYQFPIATEIYLYDYDYDDARGGRSRLGTLYAIDLLGGCAGALLLSSYFIPVFGFWKTAWLSAAVNLAPTLLAARVSLEAKRSQA
ncbi:MAG: fused MFS/spermidine synthase [Acidobacteriia bacterium]|nr:fused MFS/spermidine synthase [Terriglobia bacterium]